MFKDVNKIPRAPALLFLGGSKINKLVGIK
jgi:hypothetical protein